LRRDRDQSELQKLKAHDEGSIDLYFGQKAPPGKAMEGFPQFEKPIQIRIPYFLFRQEKRIGR
jgi:hypothetical protein